MKKFFLIIAIIILLLFASCTKPHVQTEDTIIDYREYPGDLPCAVMEVFETDLNDDGTNEICYNTSAGSGIAHEFIECYDITTDTYSYIEDRGKKNYKFVEYNDRLYIISMDHLLSSLYDPHVYSPKLIDGKLTYEEIELEVEREILLITQGINLPDEITVAEKSIAENIFSVEVKDTEPDYSEYKKLLKEESASGSFSVNQIFISDLNQDKVDEIYYNIVHGNQSRYYSIMCYDKQSSQELSVHLPFRTISNYRFILYNGTLFLAYNAYNNGDTMSNYFSEIFVPSIEDEEVIFTPCEKPLKTNIIKYYELIYDVYNFPTIRNHYLNAITSEDPYISIESLNEITPKIIDNYGYVDSLNLDGYISASIKPTEGGLYVDDVIYNYDGQAQNDEFLNIQNHSEAYIFYEFSNDATCFITEDGFTIYYVIKANELENSDYYKSHSNMPLYMVKIEDKKVISLASVYLP